MNQKGFTPIILVLGLFVIGAAVFGAYYLNLQNKLLLPNINNNNTNQTNQLNKNLLTGKLEKVSDLDLVTSGHADSSNTVIYYKAGVYNRGKYKGYTRIIALAQPDAPTGMTGLIFATLNNQNYVLDTTNIDIDKTNGQFLANLVTINQTKVTSQDILDSEHTQTFDSGNVFIYNKDQVFLKYKDTITKDKYGNRQTEVYLPSDYQPLTLLPLPSSSLSLYEYPAEGTSIPPYIKATTDVIGVDSTGLGYIYHLTTKKNLETSSMSPSLQIKKDDITTTSPLYNLYDVAFPHGCGLSNSSYVVEGISEKLQKIGSFEKVDLYSFNPFSKSYDPLLKAAYENKVPPDIPADDYKISFDISKPTFEEYVGREPLLFFKDQWERWVALGEYDYKLMGGCGKPVIYLYPEKPMEVSLNFLSPVKLDIQIPNYHNGWKVLAQTNSILQDLQPEYTDCRQIDSNIKGSEYAKAACQNNLYPYIYWSGQSYTSNYPKLTKGWIVGKQEIAGFLDSKLSEIGLSAIEKADMLEYWVPELLSKNKPYYRISFLQNTELNNIIPMVITPKPDYINRIFLDYEGYDKKPDRTIEPQNLNKFIRIGFTVVEWGGLRQ